MSPAISFIPDPNISWLRHDPTMQTRDAFMDTKVVTLSQGFIAMDAHYPGGTQLLFKRVRSSADLLEGAVYALDQWNVPGYENHHWYNQHLMGRLAKVTDIKQGSFPRATMFFSFDNPMAGAQLHGVRSDGLRVEYMHFNGHQVSKLLAEKHGSEWVKRLQAHHCQLWQVTHYIAPPEMEDTANAPYFMDSGVTPRQQQWLDEEQQIAIGKAAMVTAHSKGFEYAPTLEQQLDAERAGLIDHILNEVAAIPAGRVQRSKHAIVALTRRSNERTITEFYSQDSILDVLNLLDAMCREQTAMAALRSRVAGQKFKQQAIVQVQSQAGANKSLVVHEEAARAD